MLLYEYVIVDDAEMSVSESFAVDDDVLTSDLLVFNDELEEDDGFMGSDGYNCSLGCC